VKNNYMIQIELEIPMAPDLDVYYDTTIYAAQNVAWLQWTPPTWLSTAQVQPVDPQFQVPTTEMDRMKNGYFAPPPNYVMPTAPSLDVVPNSEPQYRVPDQSQQRYDQRTENEPLIK